MDCHGLSWIVMDCHGLSWIVMDCHGLSWIVMDCHGLSWYMGCTWDVHGMYMGQDVRPTAAGTSAPSSKLPWI